MVGSFLAVTGSLYISSVCISSACLPACLLPRPYDTLPALALGSCVYPWDCVCRLFIYSVPSCHSERWGRSCGSVKAKSMYVHVCMCVYILGCILSSRQPHDMIAFCRVVRRCKADGIK
ncbi:hypothetical protein DFP73DRAFT_26730 [Morchella snyderi]|nr:hypothetical protein DFP73DRAFT_26730 [Morchella snyderi]